jgi:hypothetical protein
MIFCVAIPFNSVALAFMFVPFVSAVEELIAKVAVLVRADERLKIIQHVLPEME